MKIIWSPLSVDRLTEYSNYIAEENPDRASRWVDQIFSSVERLQKFPKSGRVVPELKRDEIREIIQGNYRIVYTFEKDTIYILSVRHSKQLLSKSDIESK